MGDAKGNTLGLLLSTKPNDDEYDGGDSGSASERHEKSGKLSVCDADTAKQEPCQPNGAIHNPNAGQNIISKFGSRFSQSHTSEGNAEWGGHVCRMRTSAIGSEQPL